VVPGIHYGLYIATRAELTRYLLVVFDLCKKWGGGRDQAAFGVWGARRLPWRAFLDATMRHEVRADETAALMRWRQVVAWMSHLPSSANSGHAPEMPNNWRKVIRPNIEAPGGRYIK